MTDNEIIKALECCANSDGCENCPYSRQCDGVEHIQYALDLINRQKAEIKRFNGVIKNFIATKERQKAEIERLSNQNGIEFDRAAIATVERHTKHIERRAIKEFAERFENELTQIEDIYIDEEHENFISANKVIALLVNLVKEMGGES